MHLNFNRYSTLWIVLATQGCKLLHLAGLSSSVCWSILTLSLTYSMPFARYVSISLWKGEEKSTAATSVDSSVNPTYNTANPYDSQSVPANEVRLFAILAGVATFFARSITKEVILPYWDEKEASQQKADAISVAAYLLYSSMLLFFFHKGAKLLRR